MLLPLQRVKQRRFNVVLCLSRKCNPPGFDDAFFVIPDSGREKKVEADVAKLLGDIRAVGVYDLAQEKHCKFSAFLTTVL